VGDLTTVGDAVRLPGAMPAGHDGPVDDVIIEKVDPASAEVRALMESHLTFARRHSPPEDVHALDTSEPVAGNVCFFAAWEGRELLGIGALRQIDTMHAELKSMHTAEVARGRGVGRAMLTHLLGVARSRGCLRVSLETGSMPAFAPARALYESAGFRNCEPYGEYRASPHSVCMTVELQAANRILAGPDDRPVATAQHEQTRPG
jgi:putative acetyltransferase